MQWQCVHYRNNLLLPKKKYACCTWRAAVTAAAVPSCTWGSAGDRSPQPQCPAAPVAQLGIAVPSRSAQLHLRLSWGSQSPGPAAVPSCTWGSAGDRSPQPQCPAAPEAQLGTAVPRGSWSSRPMIALWLRSSQEVVGGAISRAAVADTNLRRQPT